MAKHADMEAFSAKALELFKQRHKIYGTSHPSTVKEAVDMAGMKLLRAEATTDRATLEDSLIDCANYCSIAWLILQDKWVTKE